MRPRTRLRLLLIPLVVFLLSVPARAMHLQDAYDQAGPGEGYDKLVILDPNEIYTGYMTVYPQKSCRLQGNGALIVLDATGHILAASQSKLDVEGCIITGGSVGLNYDYSSNSTVANCTLVGNGIGIRTWVSQVTIKNCIVVNNFEYGIACREGLEPTVLYNDVWGNGALNYATFCAT
jgi:hypothetical protein